MCVCVCERDRNRQTDRQTERDRERDRERETETDRDREVVLAQGSLEIVTIFISAPRMVVLPHGHHILLRTFSVPHITTFKIFFKQEDLIMPL